MALRPASTSPFTVMANRNDVFSRFVNWLSASGSDRAAINRLGGSPICSPN